MDEAAQSLTYVAVNPLTSMDSDFAEKVYEFVQATEDIRFCLHQGNESLTHVMLIGQGGTTYRPPKRHPHYGKWICVILGYVVIFAFDDHGSVSMAKVLRSGDSAYLAAGTFHTNFPYRGASVFYESVSGPFEHSISNEDAAFAPHTSSQKEGLKYRAQLVQRWINPHV